MSGKPRGRSRRRACAVLDTNLLVGSAYAAGSASRRLVDACLRGEVVAVLSPALRKEYDFILRRAVRRHESRAALRALLDLAREVVPEHTPRVVPDDPDDDKLVAVALAAGADALVTNDRHLLSLDSFGSLRIVTPADFVRTWLGE